MHEKSLFCRDAGYKKGDDTQFAERIRKLRKKSDVTQVEMSTLEELSASTHGTYERNEYLPDAKSIYVMAKTFNVSADYILCLIDEPLRLNDADILSFSVESTKDFKRLSKETSIRNTFESLIGQKDFVQFIKYMYTYLLLTTKIKERSKEALVKKEFYDKIYYVDINPKGKIESPENELQAFDFPNNKVEIADLYRMRLHEQLDEFLKSMSKDKYFSGVMEEKIKDATGIRTDGDVNASLDFLFGNDEIE